MQPRIYLKCILNCIHVFKLFLYIYFVIIITITFYTHILIYSHNIFCRVVQTLCRFFQLHFNCIAFHNFYQKKTKPKVKLVFPALSSEKQESPGCGWVSATLMHSSWQRRSTNKHWRTTKHTLQQAICVPYIPARLWSWQRFLKVFTMYLSHYWLSLNVTWTEMWYVISEWID